MSDIDDRSRFVRREVAADARSAARTRAEFGVWLERHFTLGAERTNDLLLAVNEALTNAAEFAYVEAPQRGSVDLSAAYDDDSDTPRSPSTTAANGVLPVPNRPPRSANHRFAGAASR